MNFPDMPSEKEIMAKYHKKMAERFEQGKCASSYVTINFLGGATVGEAINEAARIAEILGTGVEFKFNSATLLLWSANDREGLLRRYRKEIK